MRTLKAHARLGLGLIFLACNPETDLTNQRTTAAGAEGGGQLPGSSGSPQSGQLIEPPSGSADIPTNLASVIVRFPEAVIATASDPAVVLQPSGSGAPVPLRQDSEVPCGGKCYAFLPAGDLAPATAYALKLPSEALHFLDGKPVPPGDAGSFATGASPDPFAPRIEAFSLQIAEGCAFIHLAADEGVRAQVALSSNGAEVALTSTTVAVSLDFAQRLPDFPADSHAQAVAQVSDRSGNSAASAPLSVALPAPVPPVVITEVLANPAGSETTQEFVEIYNRGSAPVALDGWALDSKAGKDALPAVIVAGEAYALVVGQGYDPVDEKDPAPAEGAVLVRVAGRLARDGLSNSGEGVRLLNPNGDVVSQYGGWVDTSATAWSGQSAKRVAVDACDGVDAWSKAPSPPTPGW
jgi:hypothetical protein